MKTPVEKKGFIQINIVVADIEKAAEKWADLLGIEKPVVKAHGSSKAESVCAAVLQVRDAAQSGLVGSIKEMLSGVDLEIGADA